MCLVFYYVLSRNPLLEAVQFDPVQLFADLWCVAMRVTMYLLQFRNTASVFQT